MHASTDQLLSLRDGEPLDADVADHVGTCAACISESLRLANLRDRMRSLGSGLREDQPLVDSGWHRLQPILVPPATLAGSANRYLAIAAVAVWVATALTWIGFADHDHAGVMATGAGPAPVAPALDTLLVESQDWERALHDLPRRPSVEQAATAATLDALEGQIQWLDYTLSRVDADGIPDDQQALLWQERVDLLASLVTLRYVQAGRQSL